jgi:TonB-dependent Receptor Plug Domain/Carboxypeptidase regulatory-like domain
MRSRVAICVVAVGSLLALGATTSSAQPHAALGVIDGIVTDTNLVTLSGATVSILGSALSVSTGDNGRFRIVGLHAGNFILTVHRIGYVPVAVATTVVNGDTLRPSFALQRIVSALDTMIVTAKSLATRMSEFEDRRKLGFAHFITADEIEKRNATFLADVIRTVLSVDISEKKAGKQYAYNMRGMGGCAFQIYLDGMPMPTPTNLLQLPPPRDLAGIEIYSGPATIPLQYKSGNANCGVMLLWTKIGG